MKIIALIPARAGSKGVKDKNVKYVGKERLIERAIRTCRESELIQECYVSSDSKLILEIAFSAGALPVIRPTEIARDNSSTESVLLDFLENYGRNQDQPDILVLIQCTSPFILSNDVDSAIKFMIKNPEVNSIFSAQKSHAFLWKIGVNGLIGINHDGRNRLRRQDSELQYSETGAFYIVRTSEFLKTKSRFIEPIHAFEVKSSPNIEIDTEEDLVLANLLAAQFDRPQLKFVPKVVVTDFDGVHTNDKVMLNEHGIESVEVSRSDGYGVGMLRELGIQVLILSTERNRVVAARASKLGIPCIQGVNQKLQELEKWLESAEVDLSEVLYLGNDLNDLNIMKKVGFSVAVRDAHLEIIKVADLILENKGGQNAVRELAELIQTIAKLEGLSK